MMRWLAILSGISTVVLAGCTVDPQDDYRQAQDLIVRHTGSDTAYDPADKAVEQKVHELVRGPITAETAVRIALLNNRAFQSLFHEIGVSRAEVVQSGLLSNPSLSIMLKLPEAGGRPEFTAGLVQEIVDLWQIPVRRKVAQARLERTILSVAQQAVELAADVKKKYHRYLALREAQTNLEESVALVEQSIHLALRQFEAGEAGQLDVNLVRSNTIDVRLQLITVRRDVRIARAELERALGLSRTASRLEFSDAEPAPTDLPAGDALLGIAMEQRLDVRMARLQVDEAERELRLERLEVFPSVSLGFELERTARRALGGRDVAADAARESIRSGGPAIPEIQTRGERAAERRSEIDALLGPSIELTLPLWDQNQAQIAAARYRLAQRLIAYDNMLDAVAQEIASAFASVESAGELVRFFNSEALPLAEQNLQDARRIYQAGEQNVLVVIDSQQALINRRRAHAEALGEYGAALAELERAVGGRLPKFPAASPATSPADNQERAQ